MWWGAVDDQDFNGVLIIMIVLYFQATVQMYNYCYTNEKYFKSLAVSRLAENIRMPDIIMSIWLLALFYL